jgi:hypothetical protein
MSAAEIAEMKAAIELMRVTVRWLCWAVGVLAALHGPEFVAFVRTGF